MIVGVDVRVLGSKVKSGIEEYTDNLLAHLLPLDKRIQFKLFFSSLKSDLPDYNWLHLPNVKLIKLRIPNRILFATANFLNQPRIDKVIGGADVFFSPHFFLTTLSPGCKRVTTFHDLSYIRFPEFFSWHKLFWHYVEIKPLWQAQFSDTVIAVSESTKDDLINIYNIDPAKIKVVYSGISPDIKRLPDEVLKKFKEKNNLPEKFILSLGTLEPRKNIISLIKAFNLTKKNENLENLFLVIVGSPGWLYESIFKEIQLSPYKNKIIFKNYIQDKERAFYYSLASIFVYPSFFEGFGFPPLEAMACGTPVVVSNSSSLPEVIGEGGILVNPHSISDISMAIMEILTSKTLEMQLIRKGLKKVDNFSWEKTAIKTLECIMGARSGSKVPIRVY